MALNRGRVSLLYTYEFKEAATLVFANRDTLTVPAGRYWTAAFGVVVDCINGGCLSSPNAAWKLT